MRIYFYSALTALVVLLVANTSLFAQEPTKVLSAAIKKAHESGTSFQTCNLFTHISGDKHDVLYSETLLQPNTEAITSVYENYPKAISFTLESDKGESYTLELMRSTPLAYEPDMGYYDANGSHSCGFERGAHYQGAIKGYEQSFAAISVFANGEVMMLFGNQDGNFVVGKLDDNTGRYIFYNDRDLKVKPAGCGVTEDAINARLQPLQSKSGNKTTAPYQCNKVSLYWEADFATYKFKSSSVTTTQNYMTGLFNQVQTLYRNEKIAVELKSIYIWTTADGYDSVNSSAGLNSFRNRWNAKGDTFNAHVAMLLAKDPGGNGGIAALGVLCSKPNAYAYADIDGNYSTVPTYSWDVEMVTHEHGHNIGSPHTHWCGWMTGAGGTCGSIDDCTSKESSSNCSNCTFETYQNSQPTSAWQGSIMSYCHLVARGTNLANGFGPLPGDLIRDEVSNSTSCLSSIISANLAIKKICRWDGAVTVTYNSNTIGSSNFGAAPYTYAWSNGKTTQNITGLKSPTTYILDITDSNGCKATYYAVVLTDNTPGCWPESVNSTNKPSTYVSIYPNPATQQVSVKYYATTTAATSVKLTDITGRIVKTEELKTTSGENNATIHINTLTKGIYFMQLSTKDVQYETVKLVVE